MDFALDMGNTLDNQSEDDKRLYAMFFNEAVHNKTKSDQQGRAIYDEITMVRIIVPGSKDVFVTRATETYKLRFPQQWQRFEAKQEQQHDGTPLELVPFLTVGIVAELKAMNCFTLEQFAQLPDTAMQKAMGLTGYRERARLFLEAAKDGAPMLKLQAELEKRDNEIGVLKGQVTELLNRLDAIVKQQAAVKV